MAFVSITETSLKVREMTKLCLHPSNPLTIMRGPQNALTGMMIMTSLPRLFRHEFKKVRFFTYYPKAKKTLGHEFGVRQKSSETLVAGRRFCSYSISCF